MISVPVYSDENGTPYISIYVEDEDGTFRRTQNELLRLLRDDIKGISTSQGELVSGSYDRYDRDWSVPTVTFHYGRPQSFYQFLREKVARNRFFVFTKPQLSGHITKFSLHELQLKRSSSQRKLSILKEKYVEALELWLEDEYQKHIEEKSSRQQKPSIELDQPTETIQYIDFREDALSVETHNTQRADMAAEAITPNAEAPGERRNLIQEFQLEKQKRRGDKKEDVQNSHFYKRFLFTID